MSAEHGLVFEEPASTQRRLGCRKWLRVLSPLIDRPNEWARVETHSKDRALKLACSLRSGRGTKPPAGRWEFVAAPPKDDPDSPTWAVYARYLGPQEGSERGAGEDATAEGRGADRTPAPPVQSPSGAVAARRAHNPEVAGSTPASATTPDGQPKCARRGCSRPAGKGSPWCVPQRWCGGRSGAPGAEKPVDPLTYAVELPAPPDPMPKSRLMQRFDERRGR